MSQKGCRTFPLPALIGRSRGQRKFRLAKRYRGCRAAIPVLTVSHPDGDGLCLYWLLRLAPPPASDCDIVFQRDDLEVRVKPQRLSRLTTNRAASARL
jgi:hypothetical protein